MLAVSGWNLEFEMDKLAWLFLGTGSAQWEEDSGAMVKVLLCFMQHGMLQLSDAETLS